MCRYDINDNEYLWNKPWHRYCTANALTVQLVALDGFRRMYGVKARPEDHPRAWANIVAEVNEELNAVSDDLDRDDHDDAPYWAQEDR